MTLFPARSVLTGPMALDSGENGHGLGGDAFKTGRQTESNRRLKPGLHNKPHRRKTMLTTHDIETEKPRAQSLSKAALRHEMWRRRRKVIAEVREMPVWDVADAANVTMLGNAYNELRQKALHLARIAEKDMEEHQRRIDGWKKAKAGKPMLRGKGGIGA